MSWIDWLIVIVPLAAVGYIGWRTQRHVRAVSDFLAGGRVAGRYVVAVAVAEAQMGLVSVVALFEMYYRSGFAISFWNGFWTVISLVIALTGYIVYRYRETRAMTLAQFFEVRYSRAFRIFAGLLAWISGVINYALCPAIGARFIVCYGGLPPMVEIAGLHVPTFGLIMALFLIAAVAIVLLGGQLTIMVTDCVAGLFSYAMYAVVVATILWLFSWSQMKEALLARPPGESLLNPFDTAKLQDFNLFFIFVGIAANAYNLLSWQGTQAFNAAAVSPHEQKMGKVLGVWRAGMSMLMIVLLAVAAYTYMHHPAFASQVAGVHHELSSQINLSTEATTQTIRDQMLVPIAVKHFLPVGVTGTFFAAMIFLMVSTDTAYLHSWGSIFVQDVVLPIWGRPLTPRQQMWLLRLSIVSVAVFAFIFSLYFNQVTYILMFFALSGSIWLGGAGIVIIGGLYWRRGTAAGAWAGLITGATLATAGFAVTQFWADPIYPYLTAHHQGVLTWFSHTLESLGDALPFVYWQVTADKFPITGQEIYFLTMLLSSGSYVIVSLWTCKESFNLERMLHRGRYQRVDDNTPQVPSARIKPLRNWKRILLGFDEQFTLGDKIQSVAVFSYSMALFTVFISVIIWDRLISRLSPDGWATYFWIMNILLALAVGLVTSVWFTIGGVIDLRKMFHRLATMERNVLDDGRVVGHVNAEDLTDSPASLEDHPTTARPEQKS
ncbi:MAG: sodium:solute symporter [Phycisphaeraceae bacterium]|nr:sodium:solute symporter [Phycisphaeraceae bacterium]